MISVIMSAYKAESTIKRAIESIMDQSLNDWELIIVEDHSPDDTYSIAKKYSDKDSRIKLISNKENFGAGISRSIGINNISDSSDYTTFLDSDDYLLPDCLDTLLKAALNTGADIIHPGHIINNGSNLLPLVPKYKLCDNSNKFGQDSSNTAHFLTTMLIKRSLWNNVQYSSRRYIEDTPTLLQLIYYANSILHLDYAGYVYCQNSDSLIHSSSHVKNTIYMMLHCITSYNFGKKVNDKLIMDTSLSKFLLCIKDLKYLQIKDNNYSDEMLKYKEELSEIFMFFILILNM